jgi:hypothetical protein
MSQVVKTQSNLDQLVAAYLAKGGKITVSNSKPRTLRISKETQAITSAYARRREEKVNG